MMNDGGFTQGVEITYHIANIGTLDEQGASESFMILKLTTIPSVGAIIILQSFLNVTEFLHVVEVQTHVSCQDGTNHEAAHLSVFKRRRPVPAKNLGVSSAVE